jgi:hypothetical protein
MTQEHPITPPPELVQQWLAEPEYVSGWNGKCTLISVTDHRLSNICAKAAQWGADQELEACCKMLYDRYDRVRHATGFPGSDMSDWLRAARRPKPLSLKEQALAELAEWENVMDIALDSPIRRALEALPDD